MAVVEGSDDEKPVKYTVEVDVPEGNREDFEAWWKKQGWNATRVLNRLLNYLEKQSKEGYKQELRDVVTARSQELIDDGVLDPAKHLSALAKDAKVRKTFESFQAQVLDNHVGATKSGPGGLTKKSAAQVGKKLLEADPDRLKQLADELGIDL